MGLPSWWQAVTLGAGLFTLLLFGLLRIGLGFGFFWVDEVIEREAARSKLRILLYLLLSSVPAVGGVIGSVGLLVSRPAEQGIVEQIGYYGKAVLIGVFCALFVVGELEIALHFCPPLQMGKLLRLAREGRATLPEPLYGTADYWEMRALLERLKLGLLRHPPRQEDREGAVEPPISAEDN